MGHQHGNDHCLKDPAGRAAEYDLPQSRMAIAAHHDQIRIHVGRLGQEGAGNAPMIASKPCSMSHDAMPGQMAHYVIAVPAWIALAGADGHHLDPFSQVQQGQGICDSAGGWAALVLSDEDRLKLRGALAAGHNQHRSA